MELASYFLGLGGRILFHKIQVRPRPYQAPPIVYIGMCSIKLQSAFSLDAHHL